MRSKNNPDSIAVSQLRMPRLSVSLLFVFLVFDVICNNLILSTLKEASNGKFLFIGLLLVQIVISPIQTGLSNFYGKKKGLIVSLSATLVSLILLLLYSPHMLPYFIMLVIALFAKGGAGNTIPIVWSAIGDIHSKNERFFYAISEACYAIGFLLLLLMNKTLPGVSSLVLLVSIAALVVISCKRKFKDKEDAQCEHALSFRHYLALEPRLIFCDLKDFWFSFLGLSFFFWEVSLYSMLILCADFHEPSVPFLEIFMMLGYLVGSAAMKFCTKFSHHSLIKYGYIIATFSLAPYVISTIFFQSSYLLLVISYFFHAVGNAILCPTLLSVMSGNSIKGQKERRFGILESVDTFSILVVSPIIILWKSLNLSIFYIVLFSFLTMAISWIPYKMSQKYRGRNDSKRL